MPHFKENRLLNKTANPHLSSSATLQQIQEGLTAVTALENDQKIKFQAAIAAKQAFINKVKNIDGVKIITDELEQRTEDLGEIDEAGKNLESNLRISVDSTETLEKVIQLASKEEYMILPYGGKSSGTGQFITMSRAKQFGMTQVIAIQLHKPTTIESNTPLIATDEEKKEKCKTELQKWIDLPEVQEGQTLIFHSQLPLAAIKPKDLNTNPVIIYTASTVVLKDIQDFLKAIAKEDAKEQQEEQKKTIEQLFTNITDEKLDAIIAQIEQKFPKTYFTGTWVEELIKNINDTEYSLEKLIEKLIEKLSEKEEITLKHQIEQLLSILSPYSEAIEKLQNIKKAKAKAKAKTRTTTSAIRHFQKNPEVLFAIDEIPPIKKVHLEIRSTPTSTSDATIGGAIANGAQGGGRDDASFGETMKLQIVNANGNKVILENDKAQKQVGKEGLTGTITGAAIEAHNFPPQKRAVFITVKGNNYKEYIKNLLALQHRLQPLCRRDRKNAHHIQENNGMIITAMEPLDQASLTLSFKEEHENKPLQDSIEHMFNNSTPRGLYIAYETHRADGHDPHFLKALGLNDAFSPKPDDQQIDQVHLLTGKEDVAQMDQWRHGAPSQAKEEGRLLGSSLSTDINIVVKSKKSANKVAAIYAKYIEKSTKISANYLRFYGHLHPGYDQTGKKGGSMDFHIRISCKISHPEIRFLAPEIIRKLEKARRDMYRELLLLSHDSKNKITIQRPEKSLFSNKTYWKWLCLKHPKEARAHLQELRENGWNKNDLPILAGRIPHEMPNLFPRIPNAIIPLFCKDLIDEEADPKDPKRYAAAIIELSQLSHRSPEIKRAIRDVTLLTHEKMGLDNTQYNFYIKNPEEAAQIFTENFGPQHSYKIITIQPKTWEEAQNDTNDPNKVYAVDLTNLGNPGISMMVVPNSAILKSFEITAKTQATAIHRNLYTMYEHWPSETLETPPIAQILWLGLNAEDPKNLRKQNATERPLIISANPGPVTMGDKAKLQKLGAAFLKEQMSSEQQTALAAKLKKRLKTKNHRLSFHSSATEAMDALVQLLLQSGKNIRAITTRNGSFSLRLQDYLRGLTTTQGGEEIERILKAPNEKINTIEKVKNGQFKSPHGNQRGQQNNTLTCLQTPWNTGENSLIDTVTAFYVTEIEEAKTNDQIPILFHTPHKTSTGVSADPNKIIAKLSESGYTINQDYFLICDTTSGAGAIDYSNEEDQVPFSTFCSFQKGLQSAAGLASCLLHPELIKKLGIQRDENASPNSIAAAIYNSENGQNPNPRMLNVLNEALEKTQTPEQIQQEIQQKTALVMGWVNSTEGFYYQVPNSEDRSPIMLAIASDCYDMVVLKRLLAEIFGYHVGGGYGPFSGEAIRLYLPTISMDHLKHLLAAINILLKDSKELKEASDRTKKIPKQTRPEPFDPLQTIEELKDNLAIEHLLTDLPTITWLDSLLMTYNAQSNTKKITLNNQNPEFTHTGHKNMAQQVYNDKANIAAIKTLFETTEEGQALLEIYGEFKTAIYDMVSIAKKIAIANNDDTEADLEAAKTALGKIANILRTYLEKNPIPIAATAAPTQEYNIFTQPTPTT